MPRRLFAILATASLTLWLALGVLFAWSFRVGNEWVRSDWDGATLKWKKVWSSGGRLGCEWGHWRATDNGSIAQWNGLANTGYTGRWQYRPYFIERAECAQWYKPSYESRWSGASPPTASQSATIVTIPIWPFLLLLPILPALRLARVRRQRRQRLGVCPQCGYDLRAHAPGQKCPECGTPVPLDLVRKPMA